jgi:hypothetical protein
MIVVAMPVPVWPAQVAVTVTASGAFPLAGAACSEQTGASGSVTVRVVEVLTLPEAAVIWATPVPIAVARPPVVIDATEGASEDQVTDAVSSSVLPSVKVPVAVNCWVARAERTGFTGVIANDSRAAVPMVNVVVADTAPEVAVMVAVPTPAVVAKPLLPEALLIIATVAADELQVTTEVMPCVLPSE